MSDDSHDIATADLRGFIDRIVRLEEEKKSIADDVKDVYAEAKGRGYDPKAMKRVISLMKKTKEERDEEEGVLQTYLEALDML
jgi:uncharacterized protein (UPF0335 family)